MTFPRYAALVAVAWALFACSAKPVGYSDFDPGTDFTGLRTFTWADNTLLVSSPDPVNPALEPTLKEEVRRYLDRRGYRYTANVAEADFVIGFAVGGTPSLRTTTFEDNARQVYVVGEGLAAETVTQQSTQGGLVIDVWDRASGEKKWMGWTVTEVTGGDQANLRPLVRDLTEVILQHFPPERPAR